MGGCRKASSFFDLFFECFRTCFGRENKPKSVIRTLECGFLLLFDDFCVFLASFVLLFVSIARYASRKEKRNLLENPSKIITNPNDRIGVKQTVILQALLLLLSQLHPQQSRTMSFSTTLFRTTMRNQSGFSLSTEKQCPNIGVLTRKIRFANPYSYKIQ